jgi:signal transduction histidine kinase
VPFAERLLARARALPPARQDQIFAALIVVAGLLDVGWVVRDAPLDTTLIGIAGVAAVATGVGLRRVRPLVAIVLGFGALAVMSASDVLVETNIAFLGMLVIPFALARYADERRYRVGLVLIAALLVVSMLADPWSDDVLDYVFSASLFIAAPVIAGRLLRNRAALAKALAQRTARLEAERGAAAARAVEEERTRIAAELHDVVSHALGAMVVGAGAARRLSAKDPERAAQAFQSVEETGREALMELRRLLGVLRREDEELALAPQPSLANLGDLARRMRRSGLPVELHTAGEAPETLSPGVDLTAYRLVQAALAAARDGGAAGRAEVDVRYEPGRVHVTVDDDGTAPVPRALLGMRERVRLYGGEVHAGPRSRGGHRVRAELPLEVPA